MKTFEATKHDGSKVLFNSNSLFDAKRYCIIALHFIPTFIKEV